MDLIRLFLKNTYTMPHLTMTCVCVPSRLYTVVSMNGDDFFSYQTRHINFLSRQF